MKVLEKGGGWSIQSTCTGFGNGDGGCGARLEMEENDLFKTAHTDYGGGRSSYITFRCPQCQKLTDLPKNEIPSAIRQNLPTKAQYDARTQS